MWSSTGTATLPLGRYGTPESQQAYHRKLAEWLANGRRPRVDPDTATVTEVCAAYWRWAKDYYLDRNGSPTGSVDRIRQMLKVVKKLYGPVRAAEFGPLALRAVRQVWIDRGYARKTVNDYTAQVKRLFKWAVAHELVPPTVYQGLACVEGLKAGRSAARETDPAKPVPQVHIDATKLVVSRPVRTLIDLQLLTGARPGELLTLRPIDFDCSGQVWTATIEHHKTAYRGKLRVVYFGPRAQKLVRPFLSDRPVDAYMFSPREAETDRHAQAPTHRWPDQKPNPRKTDRRLGLRYTKDSYRRAITRACEKAGVPVWTPYRLRHNAATRIRREYGLEAAQVILGHSTADVTQIYAERDEERAIHVARMMG